ncbi:MAG: hypothetical protein ABI233_01105 [Chthoniobacterales bacterium]
MAEKSGSGKSKTELRREIADSRGAVARDLGGLSYELNFPLKVRKSFQRNTVYWVGGALAFGLFLALLRARTQKVYLSAAGNKVKSPNKKLLDAGLLLGLVRLASPLIQPVVMGYFAKKMSKKAGSQQRR